MRNWLDKLGIGLSGLCLVHCLLLPVVILMVPALAASFFGGEWIHLGFVVVALPVSLLAFWRGLHCHKGWHPGLFGLTGLAFLISGVLLPVEEMSEVALTVTGALLLALGHFANQRLMIKTAAP